LNFKAPDQWIWGFLYTNKLGTCYVEPLYTLFMQTQVGIIYLKLDPK